jgi:adenosylmethionine-8-amino-7-oxononanoate aminotransferase
MPKTMSEDEFVDASLHAIEEEILREDPTTIAAFFFEPISWRIASCPPVAFWRGLTNICKKHSILLVADEIVTGFCRTGAWFRSQTCGADPDIICLAKAITGAMFPCGAVVLKAELDHDFADIPLVTGYTNGGNPVGCAAAIATIDEMSRMDICANVCARGSELMAKLREVQRREPMIGDVRGEGLMIFLELVKGDGSKSPIEKSMQEEILVELQFKQHVKVRGFMGLERNVVLVCPPLIITSEEVDEVVLRLSTGIASVRARTMGPLLEERDYYQVPGLAGFS